MTFLSKCMPCTVPENRNPGKQAQFEGAHPERGFYLLGFAFQIITPKTKSDNTLVIPTIDMFTRLGRALPMQNGQEQIFITALIAEWTSTFGPMKMLLYEHGSRLT